MLDGKLERTFLVLNKVDALASKTSLLPTLDKSGRQTVRRVLAGRPRAPARTWSGSSRRSSRTCPSGPKQFPKGMVTDRDLAFRIAETIREKLMTLVHKEVPYGMTVEVEHLGTNEEGQRLVHALIWLERESQKSIVIGKAGERSERGGHARAPRAARAIGERVHLELWVKVREHWADSERELQRLGFEV